MLQASLSGCNSGFPSSTDQECSPMLLPLLAAASGSTTKFKQARLALLANGKCGVSGKAAVSMTLIA